MVVRVKADKFQLSVPARIGKLTLEHVITLGNVVEI